MILHKSLWKNLLRSTFNILEISKNKLIVLYFAHKNLVIRELEIFLQFTAKCLPNGSEHQ